MAIIRNRGPPVYPKKLTQLIARAWENGLRRSPPSGQGA